MPHPEADPHLRLDLLDGRPGAVTATITSTPTHTVRALLALHGFEPLADTTMVMARIDREEPYYAELAARALRAEGVTVDITPQLQEEIDTEWTWANYPMPWCSREEIREVSNDAQQIYDDIRHGRLIIHAHAHDGWTTVAVGTYRDGPSIHLHGENHLRVEAGRYDTPAKAIAEFERLYGDAVRPGPAPATSTERDAEQARTPSTPHTADAQASPATTEPAEVDTAGVDAHEALLKDFLESHGEWERWRTWSDDTTHAVHESLVLRAEFVHEAAPDDTQWKIAAYESPVGERLWHATASTTVPVEIMRVLLDSLASADAAQIAAGSKVSEAAIGEATRPLADAGWEHAIDGRWIRWQAPGDHAVGVHFDAFAAHAPHSGLPAWTVWGGGDADTPRWALHFSPHAAASVLQDVAFEVAHVLTQKPVTARRQGLNPLTRNDIRAQLASRAGSSRSR
ncbi:DUF317 domain-containing protein [Streptomyces himalayensis]|uniref:DUF317 domain-containing protein n=1 Tax=Streptomyces himalayensis subsp. himalayensis TaxID=2756131 RepID=A0A7W0DS08_9ACTN|nr:DUF317 domain-containing protein [Streptomyces himalayensis]MBA2950243.1 DUF317 domain-containing protein [Streptomyces himalayensis subsp. himalayensis]